MGSHRTLLRALKMAGELQSGKGYTLQDFARYHEVTTRTIRNTIDTLKDAGYVIRQEGKRWYGETFREDVYGIGNLLYFSEVENVILNEAINRIDVDDSQKELLVEKLHSLYAFDRVVFSFKPKEEAEAILEIDKAIKSQKRVILKDYKSSNSGRIQDRMVEPYQLDGDLITLWCFEPSSGKCKTFKIGRIGSVDILEDSWQFQDEHVPYFQDCFGMTGEKEIPMEFEMSLMAYNLLIEEHPLANELCYQVTGGNYKFDGSIAQIEGVGRFVLGLLGEIDIGQNEMLNEFIIKKIREFQE